MPYRPGSPADASAEGHCERYTSDNKAFSSSESRNGGKCEAISDRTELNVVAMSTIGRWESTEALHSVENAANSTNASKRSREVESRLAGEPSTNCMISGHSARG